MCSIFGYYKLEQDATPHPDFLNNAFNLMRHRGPDFEHCVPVKRACLGHQRLSIIDTSESGRQPMLEGSYLITFNGEIYNYVELQRSLLPYEAFRSTSDTEVLLKLLERFGPAVLNKLNGMFAFGFYDLAKERLILVRDRFGVKPLYYMIERGILYFASEIKPLASIKKIVARNWNIYQKYITELATDFNDETHVEGIYQVRKGHYLSIDDGTVSSRKWYHGHDSSIDLSIFNRKMETLQYFESLLTDAIRIRMRSDVPVSLTLSGGLDSSVIYILLKEKLNQDIKCYSFSHPGRTTDESNIVKRLVGSYGDSCKFISTSSEHRIEDWNKVVSHLEFPSWSFSALAYSDIYRFISEDGCRVVIEGHGSDEQLGGYSYMVEQAAATYALEREYLRCFQTYYIVKRMRGEKLYEMLKSSKQFISFLRSARRGDFAGFHKTLQGAFDFKILPIVLRTFDRMSMMHSVESRSPFMDYRIVEFLTALPLHMKVSSIGSKAILRELLKKHGFDFIYKQHKKQGFSSDEPIFLNNLDTQEALKQQINSLPDLQFSLIKREAEEYLSKNTHNWDSAFPLAKASSLAITDKLYGFSL